MIYLDYAATTKPSKSTIDVMHETMESYPGNPSSLHSMGIVARKRYNEAKKSLATLTNTSWKSLVFTSTGTEAINLVIKGTFFTEPKKTILTSTIEHHATINALEFVKAQGGHVVEIPVDAEGFIILSELQHALDTYDVSLMTLIYANNEIGIIQPLDAVRPLLKEKGVKLHLDMVQAPAHQTIDFNTLDIDYASFSAHKFYGPRGIGFLYRKDENSLTPLLHGGKQEFSARAGTENLSGIVGLVHAFKESMQGLDDKEAQIMDNAKTFLNALDDQNIDYTLNGPPLGKQRLNNLLNIGFYNQDNQMLSFALNEKEIFVSTGSACHSDVIEPSHVIKNIGIDESYLYGCIRFSFSHIEPPEDMRYTAKIVAELIRSGNYER